MAMRRTLHVVGAGVAEVNGMYQQMGATIPAGFARTCEKQGWDAGAMWKKLYDQNTPWFEAENGSYVYRNKGDGRWWIDEPSGLGVYILESHEKLPPPSGWHPLDPNYEPVPSVAIKLQSSNNL